MNDFRGDLTDTCAKTIALVQGLARESAKHVRNASQRRVANFYSVRDRLISCKHCNWSWSKSFRSVLFSPSLNKPSKFQLSLAILNPFYTEPLDLPKGSSSWHNCCYTELLYVLNDFPGHRWAQYTERNCTWNVYWILWSFINFNNNVT